MKTITIALSADQVRQMDDDGTLNHEFLRNFFTLMAISENYLDSTKVHYKGKAVHLKYGVLVKDKIYDLLIRGAKDSNMPFTNYSTSLLQEFYTSCKREVLEWSEYN